MKDIPDRRVGQTALTVPELGFGGASLGNLYVQMDSLATQQTLETACYRRKLAWC